MKKISTLFLAALFGVMMIGSAVAAPAPNASGVNKLECFSGSTDGSGLYGGTCTVAKNQKGAAVLDTNGGDPDGEYAGVYVRHDNLAGRSLSEIEQLSFTYTGSPAGAGAPRFSVPIDSDGDGDYDLFAFVSAAYCNDGAGLVDVINDATCAIYDWNGGPYANWAAYAAAHPNYQIADYPVFIVADEPGEWTIDNVKIRQVGAPAK